MTANPILSLLRFSDVLTATGLIGVVFMLIVPLPSPLLDVLLVINIAMAMIIILTVLHIKETLEFSIFPTLLLCFTLFKLALDVSSTRMVLLQGHMKDPVDGTPIGAGKIIPAFGDVVVGGNIVVGMIMFIVLIIIQLMVITAGSERIAQVAARFTLDAMPMKQMAIDADLAAGNIDADEAKRRREKVQREADFYGSMDGAGKFVKGDSMAAIVIMIVNLVGGVLVGAFYHNMPVKEALSTFAILTVGNGLVTTIPGFLVSTAMGLLVSRAATGSNFAQDLTSELLHPKVLRQASGFMLFVSFLATVRMLAFPPLPFLGLGAFFYYLAWAIDSENSAEETVLEPTNPIPDKKDPSDPRAPISDRADQVLGVDQIALEVGRGLLSLVDPREGAKLLERVTSIRRHIGVELGLIIPGVRFRDNLQLHPSAYVIKIKDNELARGQVQVNHFLAIGPEEKLKNLRGVKTVDPTYGMPAVWIAPELGGDAERLGCMIFDPVSVVATHLTEIVRNNASRLLGRQETQALLDTVKRTHPVVVRELVPDELSLGQVQKVLQNLLRERVSIRDMVSVLETLADNTHLTKDPDSLTEFVRSTLCRTICREYQNSENTLNVLTLDPVLEQALESAVHKTEQGQYLMLDPTLGADILSAISKEVEALQEKGLQPIMLTNPSIRFHVKRLCERSFPSLIVLSWNEIAPGVNVHSLSMVVA
ncbi:MAG: flagellar biosynthesis protein FlhA [Candidatus Eremiobacteraeota bacterium]|nr:flagellar biosynthesis protein FlhA [Candidatus Eremiobacteraeota bacterium]